MTEHHADHLPGADVDAAAAPAIEARLRAVEAALSTFGAEVRTQRLAVCDPDGHERIVAEVGSGQAQLRLSFVARGGPGQGLPSHRSPAATTASVVVFACPAQDDLGPLAGLQVWADGDVVAALEAWQDPTGPWRSVVHVGDDPPAG